MVLSLSVQAQSSTNSPYSQYGYGKLADQSNGAVKGMNGMGIAWREGNQVNFSNPASYSALDSLTFLFDASASIHMTNFQEGNQRVNAKNGGFDYVMAAFRICKHLGLSFGLMPYSSVGYKYYNEQKISMSEVSGSTSTTTTNTYYGTGGFRQVFLGLGYEPLKINGTSLSIGANISYIWGSYTRSIINSYSDQYINTLSKYYTGSVSDLKYDFGLQFQQRIGKNDYITVGGVYSLGHEMHSTPECLILSVNSQTAVSDTTHFVANGRHALPSSWGAGIVYSHAGKISVGFDFRTDMWGKVKYPVYSVVDEKPQYEFCDGMFKDSKKFTLGGQYCHNPMGRKWADRVRFRAGVSYTTPYLVINGQDGPKEISASIGVGLPIANGWNNRSMLNVSAKWTNLNAPGLIKENTFMLCVGLTFNERWFAKWEVQ